MIDKYGLEIAETFLKANIKLSKEAQAEVKELLLYDYVNQLCNKFTDAKINRDEQTAITISKQMNKLNKISIFKNTNFGYHKIFIMEIQAFHITKRFEFDVHYSDNLFDNLSSLSYIYR